MVIRHLPLKSLAGYTIPALLLLTSTFAKASGFGLIEQGMAPGAGMAFLLAGDGLPEAATFGNVLGALVATKPGGTPTLSRREIEAARTHVGERTVDETLSRFIRERRNSLGRQEC